MGYLLLAFIQSIETGYFQLTFSAIAIATSLCLAIGQLPTLEVRLKND